MKIIIDTNIVFSALISKESTLRDILLEYNADFYAPNYIFVELFRYKDKLFKYSKLTEDEIYEYINLFTEKIHFVSLDFISLENRNIAYSLCKEIDIKDMVFVALTIELNGFFWTGDKKLKNHLIQKGFNQLFHY